MTLEDADRKFFDRMASEVAARRRARDHSPVCNTQTKEIDCAEACACTGECPRARAQAARMNAEYVRPQPRPYRSPLEVINERS